MPGLQACSAGNFPPLRQVHGGIAGHGHLGGALSFTRSGLSRKGRREHGEQRAGCGPAPSSGRWGPGRQQWGPQTGRAAPSPRLAQDQAGYTGRPP